MQGGQMSQINENTAVNNLFSQVNTTIKENLMTIKQLFTGLKRLVVVTTILLLSWVFVFLAIIGADHIVYDHLLFGLLK